MLMKLRKLTFPEFHFETEAKVDFPSACILQKRQKFELDAFNPELCVVLGNNLL